MPAKSSSRSRLTTRITHPSPAVNEQEQGLEQRLGQPENAMADLETALERAIPELNFLTIATPDIRPGALLESRRIDHYVGRIESFLVPPLSPDDFETERHPASVNLRSLSTTRSGHAARSVRLGDQTGLLVP